MAGWVLSQGFSGAFHSLNGRASLSATRPDIIRSLLTVGYPGRRAAIHTVGRWRERLLVALATGYLDQNLATTRYFRNLEQSEKSGASFLLGEAFTHWYAQEKLRIKYLVHAKGMTSCTWTKGHTPAPKSGAWAPAEKSRPDFIGVRRGQYHVFESKGRVRKPSAATVGKALGQVSKLISVNGLTPTTRCACFFMLKESGVEGHVVDPPTDPEGLALTFDEWDALTAAYSFFLDVGIRDLSDEVGEGFDGREIEEGVYFALDRKVLAALRQRPTEVTLRQKRVTEVFDVVEGNAQAYQGRRTNDASPGPDGTLLIDRRSSNGRVRSRDPQ